MSGRKFAGAVEPLVYARGLRLRCAKVLKKGLLVPILMYGSYKKV